MKTDDLVQYQDKLTAFIISKGGKAKSRVVCPVAMGCKAGDLVFTSRCSGVSNGMTGWVQLEKEIPLDHKEITSRQNVQIVETKENMPLADQYHVWNELRKEAMTWAMLQGQDPNRVPFLGDPTLLQYAAIKGLV